MLFQLAKKQTIESQWQKILAARDSCRNVWQQSWEFPFSALETTFDNALKTDDPEAWSNLSIRGRQLRESMANTDGEETVLYLNLVKLTDTVESALDEAATPENLIPRGALAELVKKIDHQNALIAEERHHTSLFQQDQHRRLDEIEEQLKAGRRTILHVGEVSLISLGIDEWISAVKDGIIAIKNGLELLNDIRFTERLRRHAGQLWETTGRFSQAIKKRFAAFRLPWGRNETDDAFELASPTFGFQHAAHSKSSSQPIIVLVRSANLDREEWRVPGAGVPFQDRWEERGEHFSGPEMIVVPAGEFMMGSSMGADEERPQHRVVIPKPFAIGRFPITFAEWDACVAAGGTDHTPEPGWGRGKQPVRYISWIDAHRYLEWLTQFTGKNYRLPSEAEWEYAARAGTQTRYCFGDNDKEFDDYGWYGDNSNNQTHPVGEKKPNSWGLFDVHGNVWEWAQDPWHDDYSEKTADLKANGGAWTIRPDSDSRVLRGGSRSFTRHKARSAARDARPADNRGSSSGFRVVREIP